MGFGEVGNVAINSMAVVRSPWEARKGAGKTAQYRICRKGDRASTAAIAMVPERCGHGEESAAVARLVAAAPEMFTAIKAILFFTGPNSPAMENHLHPELRSELWKIVAKVRDEATDWGSMDAGQDVQNIVSKLRGNG